MKLPARFIGASAEFSDFSRHIAAPCLRKSFLLSAPVQSAQIQICGLGFYRLFVNGEDVTKGYLAPYISSPDDLLYFDSCDVTKYMTEGENVVGILLGNGMQNAFGGAVWEFDKAVFRGAPRVSFCLTAQTENGETVQVQSDESVLCAASPIVFDELRCGEYYDSTKEQEGWTKPGFDDSGWKPAVFLETPRGEARICECEPIVCGQILEPVSITPMEDGYLYDFGVNRAGLCSLQVEGEYGQTISLEHGERLLEDGRLDLKNIAFVPEGYVQKDIFVCNGKGEQNYVPSFTYHGFRYVLVKGITEQQATGKLLKYLVLHSDLKERGCFTCSCETLNKLQEMTRISTLSNFYYFPTDCPHREKNGWTGDASVSAEHMLLNLNPEKSFQEWLRNIRKAQTEDGALPGIVPTGGWGVDGWAGPAWDSVIINLPYYTYIYRGNTQIIKENQSAILRYLHFLSGKRDENGLIGFGLGDWCHPGRPANRPKAPEIVTDSILSMDMAHKAAFLFEVSDMPLERDFAEALSKSLRDSIRTHLVDLSVFCVRGNCQTSQAMAVYYGVFTKEEAPYAFGRLLDFIHAQDDHMDTGILGARVLFHVLSDFGYSNLAYRMITRTDFPSYGNWIARGATSLWEEFQPEGAPVTSRNHHFFGDVSHWMIRQVAGICYNPSGRDGRQAVIHPHFIDALTFARASHETPYGMLKTSWERKKDGIYITVQKPRHVMVTLKLEEGYTFVDGRRECEAKEDALECLVLTDNAVNDSYADRL